MHLPFRIATILIAAGLTACGGTTPRSSIPVLATDSRATPAAIDLYVANGGGRTPKSPGSVTVYGRRHGRLLQTITAGVDRPSVLGFDTAAGLIAVASHEPQRRDGKSGSVALYVPGSSTPSMRLKDTADPVSLAFDSKGRIYVANRGGYVGIYLPDRERPERIISLSYYTQLYRPRDIVVDADGYLYVVNGPQPAGSSDDVNIISVYPPGKSVPAYIIRTAYPRALLITRGNLYVANANPKRSKHPEGSVSVYPLGQRVPSMTITNGIHTPDALAADGAGNVYVANINGHTVSVYAPGGQTPLRVISQGVDSPKALAVGPDGNLYVSNLYQKTVSVYRPDGTSPFLTISQGLLAPLSLALNSP